MPSSAARGSGNSTGSAGRLLARLRRAVAAQPSQLPLRIAPAAAFDLSPSAVAVATVAGFARTADAVATGEAVEFPVPHAAEKGMPFIRRERQDGPLGLAVAMPISPPGRLATSTQLPQA